MIVDGDATDFQNNPQDFKRITDMIDDRLFGLFPMEEEQAHSGIGTFLVFFVSSITKTL